MEAGSTLKRDREIESNRRQLIASAFIYGHGESSLLQWGMNQKEVKYVRRGTRTIIYRIWNCSISRGTEASPGMDRQTMQPPPAEARKKKWTTEHVKKRVLRHPELEKKRSTSQPSK